MDEVGYSQNDTSHFAIVIVDLVRGLRLCLVSQYEIASNFCIGVTASLCLPFVAVRIGGDQGARHRIWEMDRGAMLRRI